MKEAILIAALVTGIVDGDTISVRDTGREIYAVRLACIDAPEMSQNPWGTIARDRLISLVPPQSAIRLRVISKDIKDIYGRTVAEVYKENVNINLIMVGEGHAAFYRQYSQGCDRAAYDREERSAKDRLLNFWSQQQPVLPWDWRRDRRSRLQSLNGTVRIPRIKIFRSENLVEW